MKRETGQSQGIWALIYQRTDIYCARGFKGLKQAVKLEYKLGKYDKVQGSILSPKPSAH